MDWIAITEQLQAATVAAVDMLSSLLEERSPYAVCLQTADDGMSVGFCANTEEGYAEKLASEAEIEDVSPDYAAYLRWAPAEWRYEGFGDDFSRTSIATSLRQAPLRTKILPSISTISSTS